jgi:DNA invertase Pin-like site-specific DNA recombinase
MTNVVIYARKSTEQTVNDDAKSVTRQVELARAFAVSRGWTIDDACVYVDDGISGAEFETRPGLTALMLAAKGRPRPFDVMVLMDESRLGRDQWRTAFVLQQIADAEVQLWYYQEG